MSALTFRVDTIADAHRLIETLSRTGYEFRIPLVRAMIERRICHQEFQRTSSARSVKVFLAASRGRPAVTLLGDDDDVPTGPAGWPQAHRLIAWAALVIIHGTGGERRDYEAAIDLALIVQRVLFVETDSAHLPAWIDVVAKAPHRPLVKLHEPFPGLPHPLPADGGMVLQ